MIQAKCFLHCDRDQLPHLALSDVHLWSFAPLPEGLLGEGMACLALEEQLKYQQMQHSQAQTHFLMARLAVRLLLAYYQGSDPETIVIDKSKRGKPFMRHQGGHAIFFNTSHSSGQMLVAMTRLGEVGVDIKSLSRKVDVPAIAKRYFHAHEVSGLVGLGSEAARQAFLHMWTVKEALLKALGHGVAGGLNQFELSVVSPYALVHVHRADWSDHTWQHMPFVFDQNMCGALAVMSQSPIAHVHCLQGQWRDWL